MVKTEQELPPDLKSIFVRAMESAKKDQHDYAIELLQMVVLKEPAFLKGRQLLRATATKKVKGQSSLVKTMSSGKISLLAAKSSKKEPQKSLEVAEKILELDPHNKQGANILAEAAMALDLKEVAAFAYETFREAHLLDVDNLHKLARVYMAMKSGAKAEACFNALLKINAADTEAIKGLKDASALGTIEKGNWDNNDTYKGSMKNADEAAKIEAEKRLVKTDDQILQGISDLQQMIQNQPGNLTHYRKVADLYFQIKDWDNALGYYKHFYNESGQIDSSLAKLMTEIRVRRSNDWIEQRQKYIEAYPDAADVDTYKQEIQQITSERDEMLLKTAEEQVGKYPNNNELRFDLGEIYLKLGRFDEAQRELQMATKAPSKRLTALNYLGQCFLSKGMLDMAIAQFQKAASEIPGMDSTKKEILYNLGDTLWNLGKFEEAMETGFKPIYQVDFSYRDVGPRVEDWYRQQGASAL
ncbi:MAG: tetratricopeptide repeat protein [Verrucomicrobiota bacterium]|nr:tetratricopeptide repeat protein [Verrucomicrobiota bacterium]